MRPTDRQSMQAFRQAQSMELRRSTQRTTVRKRPRDRQNANEARLWLAWNVAFLEPTKPLAAELAAVKRADVVSRKSKSQYSVTFFKSRAGLPEEVLRFGDEGLAQALLEYEPRIADPISAGVVGIRGFGSKYSPLIGIKLEVEELHVHRRRVLRALRVLAGQHLPDSQEFDPHMSVLRADSAETGRLLVERLEPVLPERVVLAGVTASLSSE